MLSSVLVVCAVLVGLLCTCESKISSPTGFGTKLCKKWPNFDLQDYNPENRATYLQSYGLGDIQPRADVTVVGLYFADSNISQQAIRFQEKVYYSLRDKVTVQNVALNFYAPKQCSITDCEPVWTLKNWWYYESSCDGYVGSCAPGEFRTLLQFGYGFRN
jgi:hypothetical protein